MPDEDREKALELVKDPAKKPRSHFLRFELRSFDPGRRCARAHQISQRTGERNYDARL